MAPDVGIGLGLVFALQVSGLMQKNGSPLDPPDPAGHTEIVNKVYTPIMDEVLYGRMTPEDAAKQFREQASAILAK